ncbi:FAD-binding oxidoreductase [Aliagarivorans marinus]|uniref:FAD-binding oxidoreductase n=1 Tax=Aliagarivorans marinus TaxID=561965 RepID=UPI00040AFFBB|nr:2Fe-2S iron-sulfur cluster binding domain-containing protein [Aliagarivorans marinus]
MAHIYYQQHAHESQQDESVLDTLLRHGHGIDHGCRSGQCQSCLMQVVEGEIPAKAQQGLSPQQKQRGYVLSCQCPSDAGLHVMPAEQRSAHYSVTVLGKQQLSQQVLGLSLSRPFDYQAGQFINLHANDCTRSYSLASSPGQHQHLELQIKTLADGQLSPYLLEQLQVGDQITVTGPFGECSYNPQAPEQDLLLVGIGTGASPLYGILREALSQQHQGHIDIVLGARQRQDIYLHDYLSTLSQQYPQLSYHPCSQQDGEDIYRYVTQQLSDLASKELFICGADSFVQKMRKQCFLAGAAMNRIHCDRFTAAR